VLAAEARLSPYHFHRIFKRVAGVTPRAYAAALRERRAREALAVKKTVTEAVYDAGFNSSGRFYENTDAMLGMTPTAWKKGGAGETIWHAVGQSSLGTVLVAATAKGIAAIVIGDDTTRLEGELKKRFPKAKHVAPPPEFKTWITEVVGFVDNPKQGLGLPLDIRGTAFQRRVWQELRKVPAGETITYGQLAARVGRPKAVRAVGTACGANAIAVAIPCHRAVGANGSLTGYRWGVERKRRLLERERN
jgi:AraC family transcriptional regulator of adaptative response/methylated-DNA-[protein]-cysteine methyltransferase